MISETARGTLLVDLARSLAVNLPDFLTHEADGAIRLTGRRIGLHYVVRLYQQCSSVDKLRDELPELEAALLDKVVAFYRENQAEVDSYVADQEGGNQRLSRISTLWTMLERARSGVPEAAAAAQCLLMQRYYGVVYH